MNELFKNLKKYKSKTALIDDNLNKVDYNDLFQIKNRFKKLFPSGSIALILVDNSIDSISTYIGFLDLKLVKVIVDNNISIKFFKNLKKKYNPKFIICLQSKMKFFNIKGFKILNRKFFLPLFRETQFFNLLRPLSQSKLKIE